MAGSQKKKSVSPEPGGRSQPDPVSPDAVRRLRQARKGDPSVTQLFDGIRSGDIPSLSRAITLVESSLPRHQELAQELIAACLPCSGTTFRLGITGLPGAGKSTFIEALGKEIIDRGGRLAVLAIDPSSKRSSGSILGDKTRMEELAARREAYIRPSPSGGTLGGVARKTRETMILCEAAGFDNLLVETVGVGQSETTVHGMVDFFLLVLIPGAGDELQGIKRGVMEMADAIVINKADGENLTKARQAQAEFTGALHLFPPAASGWIPQVRCCSSLYREGIRETWEMIQDYRKYAGQKGYLLNKRREQSNYWMHETIREGICDSVLGKPSVQKELVRMEEQITQGKITSYMAASRILKMAGSA